MEKLDLKFKMVESDYFRIYFMDQSKGLWCFQESSLNDFSLYNCSRGGEPECDHPITLIAACDCDAVPDDADPIVGRWKNWMSSIERAAK